MSNNQEWSPFFQGGSKSGPKWVIFDPFKNHLFDPNYVRKWLFLNFLKNSNIFIQNWEKRKIQNMSLLYNFHGSNHDFEGVQKWPHFGQKCHFQKTTKIKSHCRVNIIFTFFHFFELFWKKISKKWKKWTKIKKSEKKCTKFMPVRKHKNSLKIPKKKVEKCLIGTTEFSKLKKIEKNVTSKKWPQNNFGPKKLKFAVVDFLWTSSNVNSVHFLTFRVFHVFWVPFKNRLFSKMHRIHV